MTRALPAPLPGRPSHAIGPQSDLVPLFLLRYDRENTRRAYRADLLSFFGSDVVTLEMASAVSFSDINAAIQQCEVVEMSPATIRRRVASWRAFFSWLTALGFLDLNPTDRHLVRRIPKVTNDQLLTVLTKTEAKDLVDAVDMSRRTGKRDRALVLMLLHCVLRRSEAAAMNVEDIRQSGPYHLLNIKKAKGGANQVVKIPPHVYDVLDGFVRSMGYVHGPVWRSFSTNGTSGKRLSGSSIYKIVSRLGVAAGLPSRIGAHTLRHTGCTLAIEGGASIQQVQHHARHKNVETTMRYIHQRDRLSNSAADYIDI